MNNSEEKNIVPLDEISFPDSFFREEVRNGFYITTMMKRYWAGQLQMLSDIDKLCKKPAVFTRKKSRVKKQLKQLY